MVQLNLANSKFSKMDPVDALVISNMRPQKMQIKLSMVSMELTKVEKPSRLFTTSRKMKEKTRERNIPISSFRIFQQNILTKILKLSSKNLDPSSLFPLM